MHKRRIGLVGAQRKLRPEGVGVVMEANTTLGGIAGAEVGGDPEVVIEIPSHAKIEAICIDSTLETRVLISTKELRLRMVRLSCHSRDRKETYEKSHISYFSHVFPSQKIGQ